MRFPAVQFLRRVLRRALTRAAAAFVLVAFSVAGIANEAIAQGDDAEPPAAQFKKTIIVEPEGDGQPTVTIFTDDRSIKDISEEAEATAPSEIRPYEVSPRRIQSLMEATVNASTPSEAKAMANDADAMAQTLEEATIEESASSEEGDLAEILGQSNDRNFWILLIIALAIGAILITVIYKRRKQSTL